MKNLFLEMPTLFCHATVVEAVEVRDDALLLAPVENILRPSGGGQPQDRGWVRVNGATLPISKVFKADGRTWIQLDVAAAVVEGEPITLVVDEAYRNRLSRAHTMTHLLMAAARNIVSGYESKGATIGDQGDRIELRFRSQTPLAEQDLTDIAALGRHIIDLDRPVVVAKTKSPADAANAFRQWRVDPDLGLSGRIRVINIEGVDQNPCSGTHAISTGVLGTFKVTRVVRVDDDVNIVHIELSDELGVDAQCAAAPVRANLAAFDLG